MPQVESLQASQAAGASTAIFAFAKSVDGPWRGAGSHKVEIQTDFDNLRREDVTAVATLSHFMGPISSAHYHAQVTDVEVKQGANGKQKIVISYQTYAGGDGDVHIVTITFSGIAFGR